MRLLLATGARWAAFMLAAPGFWQKHAVATGGRCKGYRVRAIVCPYFRRGLP